MKFMKFFRRTHHSKPVRDLLLVDMPITKTLNNKKHTDDREELSSMSKDEKICFCMVRGGILKGVGEHKYAIYYYNEVVQLDPKHFSAFDQLAEIYQELGENESALDCLKKAEDIVCENFNFPEGTARKRIIAELKEKIEAEKKDEGDSCEPRI